MHSDTTFFNYSPRREIEPKQTEAITGNKLFLAVLLSLLVMGVAVLLGLQIASATGILWLGFLPLAAGWALLYPAFKKLEA